MMAVSDTNQIEVAVWDAAEYSEVDRVETAEWGSLRAPEAINKYGYIMGDDFIQAMDWLADTETWGTLQPCEVPMRVKAVHGIDIPPGVRAGLYMMKGMWEVEKKRRYETSNKALLDEYDGEKAGDIVRPLKGGHTDAEVRE